MSEKEKQAMRQLARGNPLVVDSSETGQFYVDFVTAQNLKKRGLVRIDERPFHTFVWPAHSGRLNG